MRKVLSILFLILVSVVSYSQETYVFFGSYNWDKSKPGIYVYHLNSETGKLKKVCEIASILNPSYLTLSSNGRFLYACTDSKTPNAGSVSSFEFNPNKKELKFLNSQPSGGENPVYVAIHQNGKWLANANYNDGSLSIFPIEPNGYIAPIAQNVKYQNGSVNPQRQTGSHIHSAVFSPDVDFLISSDLGADKLRVYQFNVGEKVPLNMFPKQVKSAPGSGPRHFTFHPNGKLGYSIEELSGTISVYDYNNGSLNLIQEIKTHPESITDNFESSDVHVSPDGNFLYATNRGAENNIAIFSIEQNGTLKSLGYQSALGEHPRTFAIDPSGKFLIVTNVETSNVVVFKRNLTTGMLLQIGEKLKINHVSSVQIQQIKD